MCEPVSRGGSSAEVIARLDELFEQRHPSTTPESTVLVDRIRAATRAENRAAAAQLVAIGELFAYRLSRCSETEDWAMDTMAAVSAEVGAALRISQGLAGSRLRAARALREQLPKVAELFKCGDISYQMFTMMAYRTELIIDPDVLAAVDAVLAAKVARWPSLTRGRLAAQVDAIVAKVDADAVRRRKQDREERKVSIADLGGGISEIHGSLFNVDAHALDARLTALAGTVCAHDPRSREQRRADALGALAAGADRLGCRCGRADCAAGKRPGASPVVIHLIAEQASLDGSASPLTSGLTSRLTSGLASGLAIDELLPAELVAELAASAKLVPLAHPADAAPESGYVPSRALADFVRCRDLTCRWPGCDRRAAHCDIDHTIPYADGGPTHATNLKLLCRTHHLVKTFWGWRDQQLADGTVIWTAPSRHTYVTAPGSALLFPSLCRPTGDPPTPQAHPAMAGLGDRTAMMPKRRCTRAQEHTYRVATERRANHNARTAQHAADIPPPDADLEPPPF